MQNSPNTENPPIDAEAWEIAFKPYAAYPKSAHDLARHLMAVKQFLQTQPPDVSGKSTRRRLRSFRSASFTTLDMICTAL